MVGTTWNKGAGKISRYSVAGSQIPIGTASILCESRASLPGYFSVLHEEGAAWPVCPPTMLWPLVEHKVVAFTCARVLFGHVFGPECCLGTLHVCGSERSVQGTSRNCHCLLDEVWLWSISGLSDGALIFMSSAEGRLCVLSSVHSSVFQRHNLQDKSLSIPAASLWLQLGFVENGPMAKECAQGRGSRKTSH